MSNSNVQLFKLVPLHNLSAERSVEQEIPKAQKFVESTKIDFAFIVSMLPKSNRAKAKDIFAFIQADFYINEKGEAVVYGNSIVNSNVHKLLLYLTSQRSAGKNIPKGLQEFIEFLKEKCVPLHLVTCKVRKLMKIKKRN